MCREGTPRRAAIGILLMRGFVSWCMDEKGACEVQSGESRHTHVGMGCDLPTTRFHTVWCDLQICEGVMFGPGGQLDYRGGIVWWQGWRRWLDVSAAAADCAH